MEFPKQIKDAVYQLLQEPTLDHFREFLYDHTGEHNAIDFKREWIEKDKLAKLMLSLANYGGGIVIFGVHENVDKTFSCVGLKELQPKEQIGAWIKPYLSPDLKYDIYDFSYQTSEYVALNGKQFQMLCVEDTPQFIPFISRKEGANIKSSAIYTRRGTSDEQATEEELTKMIERRMKSSPLSCGTTLTLEEHLEQLRTLYRNNNFHTGRGGNLFDLLLLGRKPVNSINKAIIKNGIEKGILDPSLDYEEFVSTLIEKKKEKIERVLDLR